jgi:hypothetical protein
MGGRSTKNAARILEPPAMVLWNEACTVGPENREGLDGCLLAVPVRLPLRAAGGTLRMNMVVRFSCTGSGGRTRIHA